MVTEPEAERLLRTSRVNVRIYSRCVRSSAIGIVRRRVGCTLAVLVVL